MAGWLARAKARGGSNGRAVAILFALEATKWIAEKYLPSLVSYFDPPKTLQELQDAAQGPPKPGYEDHHIVETQKGSNNPLANSKVFSEEELEGRENLVRTPYWKHREISDWYSTPNRDFDWKTPRDYLRGKDWKEQYTTFENMSDGTLVDEFVQCATVLGKAVWEGDNRKAKQFALRKKALDHAFRKRGPTICALMLTLLRHPNEQVRYSAAKELLAATPEKARACIEDVASGVGPIAGAAGMTL
jgi:hypothetical protein